MKYLSFELAEKAKGRKCIDKSIQNRVFKDRKRFTTRQNIDKRNIKQKTYIGAIVDQILSLLLKVKIKIKYLIIL